ncbi:MAG: class I SAM-dependent methyltransferase [Frankiaceae bacterium]
MSDTDKSARARSFGAVAEQYDAARPGYPDALFDDLAAMLPGPRVVEIGAGTGKATGSLLARGLQVTAVEPDPEMARVLRRRHGVGAIVAPYEEWTPDGSYDALVSAQAWHWTDPATRYDRAARALRPGGVIALLWNIDLLDAQPLHDQFAAVFRAHGIDVDPPFELAAEQPADPLADGPGSDLAAHPSFDAVQFRRYPNERTYTGDELVALFETTSLLRTVDEDARRDIGERFREIVAAAPGGVLAVHRYTALFTARRVAP